MRYPLSLCVAAAILGLPALAGAQPARVNVYTYDFEFSINPPGQPIVNPVINVGDLIVWIIVDDFHNTVAAAGQAEFWDTPIMFAGDSFEYVFTIPGTYNYYCLPHGSDNGDGTVTGMSGKVTVLPAPAPLALFGSSALLATRRRRR